ncbi:galactokinase [Fusobacterium sp.]|uniref:galactokinase n=1 Tax=Fusobacterium sp. TaxID=68766 RepID=UPI00396C7612
MIEKLIKEFKKIYNYEGKVEVFFSPGRVNLIGEHTDYNGGFVFPCALNFGTYGVAVKREDNRFRMYSMNFENVGIKEFTTDELVYKKEDDWVNYPKGVIKAFKDAGFNINKGFDLLICGTIPNGAGLSSSASLELLISVILKDFNNLDTDMVNMIKLSQKAENEFIGVNCGIMDQFAIGMGKENNAILLDCNSLEYKYAPISLNGASVVIANTNKKRGLADSKYNERRASCEAAVKTLNGNGINIKYLGELTVDEFNKVKHFITDPEQLKRATHAVTENARTQEAVKKLNAGDIEGFGKLMNQSHISLRDDYEVTGVELDSLVGAAWKAPGVIGSRMTGAGFGGCTVSIVKDEDINKFIEEVGKEYKEKTGLTADFYVAKIGDGSRKLGEF